ncbi:MAG TPA: transcriptional regulator [Candidatus Melainabacteria bacterium]|nr:transcriptional regulator [Candidatus Melainabacteria bacterium]HIN66370.1 transcriptional regulator [Candidatus Obscuribacterales bacterium]
MAVTLKPQDTPAIDGVLKLLSPRWTIAVLIQLSSGKKRTGELLKNLAPISAKTLTERLTTLRKYGFIERTAFKVVPPRVEYALTVDGAELVNLLKSVKGVCALMVEEELHNWGNPTLR